VMERDENAPTLTTTEASTPGSLFINFNDG